MLEWYYTLGLISYGIFIIQFILSWFGGDSDLDVDLDGETDMDVSDVVSFKGLLHFVMGFSSWLSLKGASIVWWDYLIAIACGILFMFILYYLYKLMMKLDHRVVPQEGEQLIGSIGTVYLITENYYVLLVEVNGASTEIRAFPKSEEVTYSKGAMVRISEYIKGKYYFE